MQTAGYNPDICKTSRSLIPQSHIINSTKSHHQTSAIMNSSW